MLVLSRRNGEKIEIQVPGYPPIEVMVTEIRGDKVRLGFTAPPEVKVYRTELLDSSHEPSEANS